MADNADNFTTTSIGLGEVSSSSQKEPHVESTIQADTLFTFCKKLDFILSDIKAQALLPRYVGEDLSYLRIKNLDRIAIPMKCFCDISLHRLKDHIGTYGSYGLAFSKEWGMDKGIQPIQYINPQSQLCKDFIESMSAAIDLSKSGNGVYNITNNYMLHQLMYYKPYQGQNKPLIKEGENEPKCFADECEWRYVPKLSEYGLPQLIYDSNILYNGKLLDRLNKAISDIINVSLTFTYKEIKYIIIQDEDDHKVLSKEISNLSTDEYTKFELLSKIIIWNKSKGDF